MNIGELKELIKDMPDNTPVTVKGGYFYCFESDCKIETISMINGEMFKHDVEWLTKIDALDEVDKESLVDVLLFDGCED